MKLYKLTLRDEAKTPEYDISRGFIVRAKSPNHARKLASVDAGDEGPSVWLDAKKCIVKRVTEEGECGVVLCDYKGS